MKDAGLHPSMPSLGTELLTSWPIEKKAKHPVVGLGCLDISDATI